MCTESPTQLVNRIITFINIYKCDRSFTSQPINSSKIRHPACLDFVERLANNTYGFKNVRQSGMQKNQVNGNQHDWSYKTTFYSCTIIGILWYTVSKQWKLTETHDMYCYHEICLKGTYMHAAHISYTDRGGSCEKSNLSCQPKHQRQHYTQRC